MQISVNQYQFATADLGNIQFVQELPGQAASGNLNVVGDQPFINGNFLIACVAYLSSNQITRIRTLPDNEDSFNQVFTVADGLLALDVWSCAYTGANDYGYEVISQDGLTPLAAGLSEWSGLASPGVEDAQSRQGTDVSPTSELVAATSPNSLHIVAGTWGLNQYSSGPNFGYTRLTPAGVSTVWLEVAYKIFHDTSTHNTKWTLGLSIPWIAQGSVFGAA